MRQAGTISTQDDAQRFVDYLLTLGITSKIDRAGEAWAVWVHDENQVERSRVELEQFEREPNDPRYQQAERQAKVARRESAEKLRQARRNYVDLRSEWAKPWRRRPVTVAMAAACVVLALNILPIDQTDLMFSWPAIESGQVWRLVTPSFLHAPLATNPLHLIFNVWVLFDLGTLIERRIGSLRFAVLALLVSIFSNYVQFLVRGPLFLGMSGVVFGLFGYAWVRGRLDPTSGLYLRPNFVLVVMAWFFLCAFGVVGNVANWAHGGGLVSGAALGYMAHTIELRQRKP